MKKKIRERETGRDIYQYVWLKLAYLELWLRTTHFTRTNFIIVQFIFLVFVRSLNSLSVALKSVLVGITQPWKLHTMSPSKAETPIFVLFTRSLFPRATVIDFI